MDIGLSYDADAKCFDLAIVNGDLAPDATLETAVLLSLYTDRRALDEDVLPDGGSDRRGWWFDAYTVRPIGSRLWLISREKDVDQVLRRAEQYAREALTWVIEDGIASAVDVEAIHARRGVMQLIVGIQRIDGSVLEGRYDYVWGATNGL
ncbi:phage GP46 family protein [Pseudomonas extremaustralis]|uniref:phage GP46 family protein n=1 Tax=Pseudomonas extremaustralis TaxID=359110 RepID=UPI002306F8FB|nr:phage GP46 family protein [Pseudomonas extremaustralis]MDB1109702.1 phage GP46 family protein [Pseudomonas extremaustralis]